MIQIAVIGATGLVGREVVAILAKQGWPAQSLRLIASMRSVNQSMTFNGHVLPIEPIENFDFHAVSVAIFSAGGAVSKQYVPKALAAGCWPIDNTSVFRLDPSAELCLPDAIPLCHLMDSPKVLSVPNCSTIQMLYVLLPLEKQFGLSEVWVSTYQSHSGAGRRQLSQFLQERASVDNNSLANNLWPQIGACDSDGYCIEEHKMIRETCRLLGRSLPIWPTTVRVATDFCHGESLCIRFQSSVKEEDIIRCLQQAPRLRVVTELAELTPKAVKGSNDVYLGRWRWNQSSRQLMLFSVSDNLRIGAALTAVNILNIVLEKVTRGYVSV